MNFAAFPSSPYRRWDVKRVIALYTGIFIVMIVGIYSYFWINDISFIWKSDGFTQHYLLFKEYTSMLRNAILHPLQGLPMWDWTIGLGADVIQSYGYYVIGDPFAYLGVLFPDSMTEFAFHFLILLRVYLIGISFLFFARKMQISAVGSVFGSVVYTFTFYVILNVTRHPFFLTPLIFLPLLCLGVEKILRNESNLLFILVVFMSAVSNFYFFYMLTLLVFIYAVVRYFYMNGFQTIKHLFYYVWHTMYSYLIGMLLSAVVFLPIAWGFLESSREAGDFASRLIVYPLQYYILMFRNLFISESYLWTVMGLASITILILPLFFTRRKDFNYLPILLGIFGVMLLFPIFGSVMNGMAGPFNRWSFAIPLFLGLAAAHLYDRRYSLRKKDLTAMGISLLLFSGIAFFEKTLGEFREVMYTPLLIAAAMWGLLILLNSKLPLSKMKRRTASGGLFVLLCFNLGLNAMDYYYPKGQNAVEDLIDAGTADQEYEETFDHAEKIIPPVSLSSVFRIGSTSKDNHIRNHMVYLDRMGLTSYLSITNGYVADFSKEIESGAFQLIQPARNGFDDRRTINHMLGVKYIVTPVENEIYLPRDYHVIHRTKGDNAHLVAETAEAYPFAYAERTVLSEKAFHKLNPAEKDAFLSVGVVADQKEVDLKKLNPFRQSLNVQKIPYKATAQDDNIATVGDDIIWVKDKKGSFELQIKDKEKVENSELYVHLKGLEFHPEKTQSIPRDKTSYTANVAFKNRNKSIFQSDEFSFSTYMFRDKMLFNLGYQDTVQNEDKIVITFDEPGLYELDDIELYALPNDVGEKKRLAEKRRNQLKLSVFENDRIEGSVYQEKDSILTTSIPYAEGWEVTVNGNKVEKIKTNIGFIGLPLEAGKSEVVFTYRTPLLRTGFVLTLIGLLLVVWNGRRNRKIRQNGFLK